jgi:xylan 1,4-beta-xylosidase
MFRTGTQRDYFKLNRYTAEAIKEVDASLRVRHQAAASEWIEDFMDSCDRNKVPADLIATQCRLFLLR